MDRAQVIEVLVAKAAELLDAPGLQEEDSFAGRGVDSLAVVEWVMDVEDATGVELTEAEVLAVPSLGALADVIVGKQA